MALIAAPAPATGTAFVVEIGWAPLARLEAGQARLAPISVNRESAIGNKFRYSMRCGLLLCSVLVGDSGAADAFEKALNDMWSVYHQLLDAVSITQAIIESISRMQMVLVWGDIRPGGRVGAYLEFDVFFVQ
ncbi:MAG: hypothetical protein SF069_02970 [Phycisphaerae bacterium]|nr:hypothetical protein [Phycisphaerae bacterium]